MIALRTAPPKKLRGQGLGPRTLNGQALDVRNAALFIGTTEKTVRGMVSRGLIPHRRMGKRIAFIRTELEAWLAALPGVSVEEAMENQGARR